MSNATIEQGYIQQYRANIQLALQAQGGKLVPFVDSGRYQGKQAMVVEEIGETTTRTRTARHEATPRMDLDHAPRWVTPVMEDWATIIDKKYDVVKRLTDPTSQYASSAAKAFGRSKDQAILDAFFAASRSGQDGSGTTAFPASQDIAVDVGAAAATGLNVAKLRAVRKLFTENHVDLDQEQIYMAITAQQEDDLLADIQVTSRDYSPDYALKDGKITHFMGIRFVSSQLVTKNGTTREVPAWVKSGLHLGIWDEMEVEVSKRDDLSYNWQIYASQHFGATRTNEKKIVRVLCAE